MIRVLVVDDSAVVAQQLSYILSSDPSITVVGTATSGEEAIQMTARLKPDILTMDIVMPGMDGFHATRRIMESTPLPIIIVSSAYDQAEVSLSFRAIEAGALAIVAKPVGIGHPLYEQQARKLVNTVSALADVRVVTRRSAKVPDRDARATKETQGSQQHIRMIVIGASTGGPQVLQTILSQLPKYFPVPIAIVQHITQGFTTGFATWLAESTGVAVCVPENGEQCMGGKVYVAPDNVHMGFDSNGCILLDDTAPDSLLKPSIAHLFTAAAQIYREEAIGVLLTGMGRDGADGLKMMRDAGAITIAQNQESSIVFGMNGEAIRIAAAQYIMPPDHIARTLDNLVSATRGQGI